MEWAALSWLCEGPEERKLKDGDGKDFEREWERLLLNKTKQNKIERNKIQQKLLLLCCFYALLLVLIESREFAPSLFVVCFFYLQWRCGVFVFVCLFVFIRRRWSIVSPPLMHLNENARMSQRVREIDLSGKETGICDSEWPEPPLHTYTAVRVSCCGFLG